jgi:uncharacterized protein YndB with AHSA1/START domain
MTSNAQNGNAQNGNAQVGTRILGTLLSADGKGVVRMQDRFDTDINDLWSALTEPRRLARWIAEVQGDDLRPGGEVRARFTSEWEGTVRVDACEPPRRLLLTTQADERPDAHTIEATLTADGDQTILVIEARGMPLAHIGDYGAGWQVHVEDLTAHIAGRERCDIEARWGELAPAYQALAAVVS